jgi:hypothetical protein
VLSRDDAERMAACWPRAEIVEVDGDYALQMENPAGLADAIASFVERAVKG